VADERGHLLVANRNQATLQALLVDLRQHAAWVATIAFYKALHIVEAVFANDPRVGHCSDHGIRLHTLKHERKYEHLYRHFSPLYRLSLVARYLEDGLDPAIHSTLEKYVAYDRLASIFLLHHLHQVEQSAAKFLASSQELTSITAIRKEILDSAQRASASG
jgi:hypothetical protein